MHGKRTFLRQWKEPAIKLTNRITNAALTAPTGVFAIGFGAAAGGSVDVGIRAWLGDEHYLKNGARGALFGAGAGAAVKLESVVADYFGARIIDVMAQGLGPVPPYVVRSLAPVLVPGVRAGSDSTLATKLIGLGADRLRSNLYFQSTTRPLKTAAEDTTGLFNDVAPAR